MYSLGNDASRGGYTLDHFFGPLYHIEQEYKLLELDYYGIKDKRQSASLPVLQAFHHWLEATLPQPLGRIPIHKTIIYAQIYHALLQFTIDGMLLIDNNQLEGKIRTIAPGRYNRLFEVSPRSGKYGSNHLQLHGYL